MRRQRACRIILTGDGFGVPQEIESHGRPVRRRRKSFKPSMFAPSWHATYNRPRVAMTKAGRAGLVALVAGAICIGFAPVLVRLSEVGPSATAFYRLLFALPFLWAWLSLERGPAS